ncbi:D-glycerate dehydrogenase [Sphingobacterium sp. SRCM116780]|uniref:2-hydroxyacid dehydrogenase n=1 Tax=Sphingobacterium sp. SRCM116780 TaxID=2907623 RepID=UPI001F15735B|nr:D-glycerate dehydrogenase [Sphingobacterium sp. SRCM116780]UIR57922.1 D-glycerate dehydrogenase [Sphingobacterium sp. SRCM116780]
MKVFITRKIPQKGIESLRAAGFDITYRTDPGNISQTDLIQKCQQVDCLLAAGHNLLDKNFFEACPHLKAIALMSAGYDSVDLDEATKHGIPVSNITDVLSNATADIAFLLLLSVSRKAFYMHKKILNDEWKDFELTENLGIELNGKTLGIFGLGRIGLELAKKAKYAYNMDIIYYNRHPNEIAKRILDAEYVNYDELLTRSDVLSVHANLSLETKEKFNKEAFKRMKNTAIFINTARGGLHQEQDLYEALTTGEIWGAGLDVTNPEPMSFQNPLLNLPNVAVLPHIGSATEQARDNMALMAANNLIAFSNQVKMPQILNLEVYQK